jgi:hypothetical protein
VKTVVLPDPGSPTIATCIGQVPRRATGIGQ